MRSAPRPIGGVNSMLIALGVIPHVEDDAWFVEAMSLFARRNTHSSVSQRNVLHVHVQPPHQGVHPDDLMAPIGQQFKDQVAHDLDQRPAVDKPEERVGQGRFRPTTDPGSLPQPVELSDVWRNKASSTCPSPGITSIRRTR